MAAEDAYKSQYRSTGGFQEAFAKAQKEGRADKKYRKDIRDAEAKELDEVNGELIVEPSGQSNFDHGTEMMAMEWKKGFADARGKFNRGELSADEYSLLKNDYLGRSKQFNAASENLKTGVSDFDQAVQDGKVSDATPAKIRDLFDTLRKGDGDLMPQNIDGVPTLTGVTAGGQAVSIPISALASGKGLPRFNEKVDLRPEKDKILKDLDSFKRQFKGADGTIYEKSLGADKLTERATESVEGLLANDSKLKSVAADDYGIADDDERWGSADGIQAIRDEVTAGEVADITDGLIERTTKVSGGGGSRNASATETKINTGRASTKRLYDDINKNLQDYIGVDGKGKELDADAVTLLQGEVGGNVESIEFYEDTDLFKYPWEDREDSKILIYKKGSKEPISFPAKGKPRDLAKTLALAKYGDEAVADTRNSISAGTTKPKLSAKERAAQIIANRKK